MNIVVDLNYPIQDGTEVVFRSPVDCSQVTGLKVYYQDASQEFIFADAHGNNVGDIDHLFAEDVVVKVILDVTKGMAFVQNADTNAYIESTFVKTVNGTKPDKNGNVEVAGGGGVEIDDEDISTNKTWSSQKISDTIAEQGGGGGITEEDVETMFDAELGDKDEIFNYTEDYLVLDTEGSYADENGENIEQAGCNVYYLGFDGTEEFAGREIRVKTYMYGDMAIYNTYFGEYITNTNANITAKPESGIFDYAFSFGPGYGTELYISFCENDFLSEPIFYEKKGTVWEEIRKTNGRQSQFVNIPYLEDALSWYVMYEEIPYLVSEQIDINMEHITEQVIAALPVYGGELA